MKKMMTVLMLLSLVFTYAQDKKKPKVEKKGDVIMVTYYYDNGDVQQEGSTNIKGKLHGTWTSYDTNGEKVAIGNYNNGKKVGKWFFWGKDILREVDYIGSKVIDFKEWSSSDTKLAVRDK